MSDTVAPPALPPLAQLRQPFPHQRRAIEQLKLWEGRALLCDEMGLGKSSTALWTLSELGATRILVVCPLSVVSKWAQEAKDTLDTTGFVLPNKSAVAAAPTGIATVRILHYDLLARLSEEMIAHLEADGLILDESHYVKNRKAERSTAVRQLALLAKYVLCLTGTPVRNDVRDLWHQVQLARPGHLFSYSRFEARYTKQVLLKLPSMRRPVRKFDGTKNPKELSAKLHDVMVMRKKKDVFDLPPKIRTIVPLEMGKAERERYDEMKRVAMVTLRDSMAPEPSSEGPVEQPFGYSDHVIARTALEQIIRLEQLTCGVLGGSSLEKPLSFADSAKIAWTIETIEDLRTQGRSVVVFCKFNATIEMLFESFRDGDNRWVLTGDTPPAARQASIEFFRGSANGGVLLCQLKLAEGFDLTPCTDAIFLGIDWTPAAMDQAEDRLHRIGTTGTVNCYYPVCERSIDKRLYRTVVEKREDARSVLDVAHVMEELR